MYPKSFSNLINYFRKMPGIGVKNAERMALYVLNNFKGKDLINFSDNLKELAKIKKCSICNNISENDICSVCSDKELENTLMILENTLDCYQIDKTKCYFGYYYIVENLIDYSKGIDETYLNINKLLNRVKDMDEVIIALSQNLQGEFTSQYLKNKIIEKYPNIKITKFATGMPSGAELKYLTEDTLKVAFLNRVKFQK